MIDKDYYSKALDYQKAATDNAFTILTILQSSTEQIVTKTMDNIPWLSAYEREGYQIWFNSCKSTTANLKEVIDKGFTSAESTLVKPTPNTPSKATVNTVKAAPATKRKPAAKSKPKSKTASSKVTAVKTAPQEKKKPQPANQASSSQPAKTEEKRPSQQDITSITQKSTTPSTKESKTTKPDT